ncbi:FAD-dependent tricarballylate dehydrogenase TcuA [Dactylosporangium sp. AC04546]|uniref:FAD-dependent tricarballylate dehydrogenase TcuA n=1 Tax=Dactylosporangium sp. AC04546 TaxID=2862460 RepID=UPI002E7BF330|nr:FAD-dependent tricarballylate dehydrogenase TcuA [Dactylosporangium sp. AC04546]WVK86950.1 FAD-dependent tricarballylate dehydrogenase TcuA [Dactylosporangium sp. AC04546]
MPIIGILNSRRAESMMQTEVLVVGAGNAAMCAALAARDAGADVLVLERAPEAERGGNTAFTAGAMRTVYGGVDDLRALMPDLSDAEIENTDFGVYRSDAFFGDMARVTDYRADPDLVEVLVNGSHETLRWMAGKGIRFAPAYGRQAFKVDGRFRFWGGLTVEVVGGGSGLVEMEHEIAARAGVRILYNSRAVSLLADDSGVHGVVAVVDGVTTSIVASAVVLASGGFQANTEWRTRYLGPGWDLAKVRGTRFNTGEGHRMALEAGASPAGHWSGCHAVGWDRNAPEYGDLAVGDGFQKHSYPFGIMVNANGRRFVDEGADFRNYTYAKYGRRILEQPNQFAWQVFDQQVAHLLRDEYRIREVTKVQAASLEELAGRLDGVDPEGFLSEVKAFNAAVMAEVPFDPTVKDGRGTVGLPVPKSNWANPLTEGPFLAFQITCGVTFTFGGVRITPRAQVLSAEGTVMPGLFACGEIVGGLFYHNYPGGTGLTAGSVFGRIAGASAAAAASR